MLISSDALQEAWRFTYDLEHDAKYRASGVKDPFGKTAANGLRA
jgi:hypothetical protein